MHIGTWPTGIGWYDEETRRWLEIWKTVKFHDDGRRELIKLTFDVYGAKGPHMHWPMESILTEEQLQTLLKVI